MDRGVELEEMLGCTRLVESLLLEPPVDVLLRAMGDEVKVFCVEVTAGRRVLCPEACHEIMSKGLTSCRKRTGRRDCGNASAAAAATTFLYSINSSNTG